MKLVAFSDNHNYFPKDLPEGDLLIIAGDMTMSGTRNEMLALGDWLKEVISQFRLGIAVLAGNHDMSLDSSDRMSKLMAETYIKDSGARYLKDELLELEGKKFWFSPWVPMIGPMPYWAFEGRRGNEIAEKWKMIPEGLDVLVTHGPPHGILDAEISWRGKNNWGDWDLKDRLLRQMESPPKVHIFGHVHKTVMGMDFHPGEKTRFYNVSIMNNAYIPTWGPMSIEI